MRSPIRWTAGRCQWRRPVLEETRLNQTAELLNNKTSAQASAKGFTFVNPTSRFLGHAVCDSVEWVNGLSNPVSESYHSNVAGHRDGYAPLVSTPLTGSAVKVSSATLRQAELSADRLASQQRRYAAVDSTIRPQQFRAPDLTTAAARAAAKRAGVDLRSRASIDAVDRSWSQRQATELATR